MCTYVTEGDFYSNYEHKKTQKKINCFVIYSIEDREPIEISFEKNWGKVKRA